MSGAARRCSRSAPSASSSLVLSGVLVVAGAVRDVHRARAAADLAALAAAGPVASGGGADCGPAASVAAANGAGLTGCAAGPGRLGGRHRVVVPAGRPGWGWLPAAASRRRLGPAWSTPGRREQ